jgi:hypothetical protein
MYFLINTNPHLHADINILHKGILLAQFQIIFAEWFTCSLAQIPHGIENTACVFWFLFTDLSASHMTQSHKTFQINLDVLLGDHQCCKKYGSHF